MSDWMESTLGELAEISIGGTPSRALDEYWASEGFEGMPWVSISDLKGRVVTDTSERITDLGAKNSNVKLVECGELLMSFKLSLGRVAYAGTDLYTNEAIATFKLDSCRIDKDFLYYQLPVAVSSAVTDTAIKGATLNKEKLKQLVIHHPSLERQKKIAKVLMTQDYQITQNQSLIDKYTAIKQGMMADLFSRGIDTTTGQLRPSYEEAPELYKETELGWVPKEWEVLPASQICQAVIDCKNRTPPETTEGFGVIKTSNIKQGRLLVDTLTHTDSASYEIWTARGKPSAGDVVITREAPVGESFLITHHMPLMCLGQRTMLYRPDRERIKPEYMYYTTRSHFMQKRLIEMAGGSTVGHVRVGDIRDLLFPVPKLEEQEAICQHPSAIDGKLDSEKDLLTKLILQKKGLMQDLLTGKVPVPV